LDIIKLKKTS